ncbi:MAG: nitroreductase family protein [Cellvibrionaceae bacterium]
MPATIKISNTNFVNSIKNDLKVRFNENFDIDENLKGLNTLAKMTSRSVHRNYTDHPIDPNLLRFLCACALSCPSKSDLQQADILIVKDPEKRQALSRLLPDQTWLQTAPDVLIFLANGRRLVEIAKLRKKPFPNNHLDLFFNASIDAGIALTSFIHAANAVGLGTCPISVIRNHSEQISDLFNLPERVIPIAGLCIGWPISKNNITPRLSLKNTVHENSYNEKNLEHSIEKFDLRRMKTHSLKPRDPEKWGETKFYSWSEDKARQFSVPNCADFGRFVRSKGFNLD